jgi:hypothetical protein
VDFGVIIPVLGTREAIDVVHAVIVPAFKRSLVSWYKCVVVFLPPSTEDRIIIRDILVKPSAEV